MIPILSKPVNDITATDIRTLIDTSAQENDRVEFKAALPANKGTNDPWTSGKGTIGEYAKKELLREVIAFANAYGGTLVIGISEDGNGTATGSRPVPQCKELANRLRLVSRDCIEPQLPHAEVFGIETGGTDGFIIARVNRSRLAPHRNTKTLECTIRRADRCEPMTMREIQDMTLNVSRGLQRVDDELSRRSDAFSREFRRLQTPDDGYGWRFTAMPVADDVWTGQRLITDGNLNERFRPPAVRVYREASDQKQPRMLKGLDRIYRSSHGTWIPRLRAAQWEYLIGPSSASAFISYRELHCNGMIELGFLSIHGKDDDRRSGHSWRLHYAVPAVEFATVALWADHVRTEAGAPGAEYVIDVEIETKGTCTLINVDDLYGEPFGSLGTGSTPFPRYSLGDQAEIPSLLNGFEHDFLNTFGEDPTNELGGLTIEQQDQAAMTVDSATMGTGVMDNLS